MEPKPPEPGRLESVQEAIFERLPVPISDPLPRALEFRRKTESWFSFPYHCLMNVEYFPHDRLVLTFSTHRVAVSGRNLRKIYQAILKQSCERVEEMDRATRMATAEEEAEIHAIDVADLRKSRAKAKPQTELKPKEPGS